MTGCVSLSTPCGSSGICTGVRRLFSELDVVASALETASTFEGSVEASCGGSLGLFEVGSFAGGLGGYAGALFVEGVCLGRRPRGPGGVDGLRVANARMKCRGSLNDQLVAGSILTRLLNELLDTARMKS
jgi:hypothetical protein